MKYAVLYQWYEVTQLGIVEADSEYMAKIRFCIKELKRAKKNFTSSDLFFIEDESIKQQIKDLAEGYGNGSLLCVPCNKEWLEEK